MVGHSETMADVRKNKEHRQRQDFAAGLEAEVYQFRLCYQVGVTVTALCPGKCIL